MTSWKESKRAYDCEKFCAEDCQQQPRQGNGLRLSRHEALLTLPRFDRSIVGARLSRSTSRLHFRFTDHGDDCGSPIVCVHVLNMAHLRWTLLIKLHIPDLCFTRIRALYTVSVSRSSRQTRLRMLRNAKITLALRSPSPLISLAALSLSSHFAALFGLSTESCPRRGLFHRCQVRSLLYGHVSQTSNFAMNSNHSRRSVHCNHIRTVRLVFGNCV